MKVFRSMLSYAQEEYGFKLSLKNVVLPKVERKQIERIGDAEQKKLVDYLKEKMSLTAFGILLSLCMGLRIGELCGIKMGRCRLSAQDFAYPQDCSVNHLSKR